jgi:hypothetical protein
VGSSKGGSESSTQHLQKAVRSPEGSLAGFCPACKQVHVFPHLHSGQVHLGIFDYLKDDRMFWRICMWKVKSFSTSISIFAWPTSMDLVPAGRVHAHEPITALNPPATFPVNLRESRIRMYESQIPILNQRCPSCHIQSPILLIRKPTNPPAAPARSAAQKMTSPMLPLFISSHVRAIMSRTGFVSKSCWR